MLFSIFNTDLNFLDLQTVLFFSLSLVGQRLAAVRMLMLGWRVTPLIRSLSLKLGFRLDTRLKLSSSSNALIFRVFYRVSQKIIVQWFFDNNSKKNRARIKIKTSFKNFWKFFIWWTQKFSILTIWELRKLSLKLVSLFLKIL